MATDLASPIIYTASVASAALVTQSASAASAHSSAASVLAAISASAATAAPAVSEALNPSSGSAAYALSSASSALDAISVSNAAIASSASLALASLSKTTSSDTAASVDPSKTTSYAPSSSATVSTSDPSLTSASTGSPPLSETVSSNVSQTPLSLSNGTSSGNTTSPGFTHVPSSKDAGTIAGAAIGAAVGAAIIAAIITYFLMRSRLSAKRRANYTDVSTPERSTFAMGKEYPSGPVVQSVEPGDWTRHLPQPTDDSSIVGTIETIYQQIELHVDNYYSNAAPSLDSSSESARALLLELDTGLVKPSLSDAMTRCRYKKMLIKQTLAYLILSNITIDDGAPGALLPRDLAELQRSLLKATQHQTKSVNAQALAYTRVLASYLRPAPYEDPALLARRDSTIKTMATTFCSAFKPWSSRETISKARYSNLVEIMRGAANGGLLLFSQRATYTFDWELKDKSFKNGVVTLPGFAKVTDDEARPLPRTFMYRQQVVAELK